MPPPLAPGGYNLYWSSADGAWRFGYAIQIPEDPQPYYLGLTDPSDPAGTYVKQGTYGQDFTPPLSFPDVTVTEPTTITFTGQYAVNAAANNLPSDYLTAGQQTQLAAAAGAQQAGQAVTLPAGVAQTSDVTAAATTITSTLQNVPTGVAAMFLATGLAEYVSGTSGPLQWTEAALALSPSASLPIGPGGISVAIVVKDTNGNPLADVDSWITSDSAGATTIAGTLETNSLGSVAFMLNAGVNYLWRMSPTYNFPNPQRITVEGSSMSITFADGTVITGPASGYAVRSDLENIFGIPNIIKWALLSANDPDSPAGLAEITARINWAIGVATVDFENAMRQGRYTLPITGSGASVWATTVVATLAGLLLYQHLKPTQRDQDGRPIPDRYDGIFTWAEQQMNFVRSGKLRLDAAVFGKGTNAPEATHERSRGAYGPGMGGYGSGPFPPPGPFVG